MMMRIKPVFVAAAVAAALALAGCTDSPAPAPQPPPVTTAPATPAPAPPVAPPVEPAPVEPAAPVDNCGLDVADMDAQTQIDCGIIPETAPADETGIVGNNSTPGTDDGLCDTAVDRADNPALCDPEGYAEDYGEPYPDYQYDYYPDTPGLYGYERCGEVCGQLPTSGDVQHQHGCEQGYITEGC